MLEITDHGRVREIRLDRPPANALSNELVEVLTGALGQAAESADAIVVSGRPGMFSAGLDVPLLINLDRQTMSRFWQNFISLLETVARSPIPVVFALTGHAPAGGIVIALYGDYRIMPKGSFKTGLNEVQVGLVVPLVAHRALTRLVGPRVAERITVAGEMMESAKALDIGLVDELVEAPEDVVPRAIAWCEQHLALPGPAMRNTRKQARADLEALFDDSSQFGVEQFIDVWFDEDTQAGLQALVARLSGKG